MKLSSSLLARIAQAEQQIGKLGFHQFRLRHHGDVARLEFDPKEMERAFRFRQALFKRVMAEGWLYVTLDMKGYRQGSLNQAVNKSGKQIPSNKKRC